MVRYRTQLSEIWTIKYFKITYFSNSYANSVDSRCIPDSLLMLLLLILTLLVLPPLVQEFSFFLSYFRPDSARRCSSPSKFPPFSQLHPSLRATPETVEPRQRGALRQQISRVAQTHPS